MKASTDFFSLPQEVKNATLKIPPVEQGYVRPGQEIFDAKEDWKKVMKLETQKYCFFGPNVEDNKLERSGNGFSVNCSGINLFRGRIKNC